MRTRIGPVVGTLALVLGLAGCHNAPNPSLVEIARSLAPPEATVTEVGENTGSRVVVGDYFALVGTDSGGLDYEALRDAAMAHAGAQGWMLVAREEHAGGTTLTYFRDGLEARVTVYTGGATASTRIQVSGQ